jgi:hypothetical protein
MKAFIHTLVRYSGLFPHDQPGQAQDVYGFSDPRTPPKAGSTESDGCIYYI